MERLLRLGPIVTTRPEGLRMPTQMKVELESISTTEARGVRWAWTFQALKRLKTVDGALVYPRMERLLRLGPIVTTRPEGLRMPTQMKVELESINTMEPRGDSWGWTFRALKRLKTVELV